MVKLELKRFAMMIDVYPIEMQYEMFWLFFVNPSKYVGYGIEDKKQKINK